MRKTIYIIIFLVISMIVLVNILSLNNMSFFGFRTYKIGSGSMEPFLKVNDTIIVKNSDNYQINDIITYQNDKEYITHRIISINNGEIITKGDANNKEDEPITKDRIVGKLIYKFHLFGYINYLLSKPITWVLLFVIGLVITFLIPNKNEK